VHFVNKHVNKEKMSETITYPRECCMRSYREDLKKRLEEMTQLASELKKTITYTQSKKEILDLERLELKKEQADLKTKMKEEENVIAFSTFGSYGPYEYSDELQARIENYQARATCFNQEVSAHNLIMTTLTSNYEVTVSRIKEIEEELS